MSDQALKEITAYFTKHKKEFVVSRYDREFYDYSFITSLFGINNIVSFGCVPISHEEELTSYIIAAIELHDNMTYNITFLDRNDITIFKFALRQLNDMIYRIKARDEISRMNKQLQRSAVTDLLTGLFNRQGFAKHIEDHEELVRRGKQDDVCATLLYIDLDNFKRCNDTFGHDVGDAILKAFSRLFERVAEDKGYIVRYGGDEFLIVMPDHKIEEGIDIAKEIYAEITRCDNFQADIEAAVHGKVEIPENHKVSCSIGIADMKKYDQDSMNTALKHADSKLYIVKKNQKSNYSVWTEEDEKAASIRGSEQTDS